jgi:uncharacterized membrane protein YgcG
MVLSRRGQRRRTDRQCRPVLDHWTGGSFALEPRLLLNATAVGRANANAVSRRDDHSEASSSHHAKASHPTKRLTPTQEINAQYAAFTAAFNNVLTSYVQSINEQSTGFVSVSTTVTGNYTVPPLPSIIAVADASVFGPEGDYGSAVMATALLGSATLGTVSITGSSGNNLIISPSAGTAISLPQGAVLSANVPTSAQSSAVSIFPSYITNSTIQMGMNLVRYFNSLPIKLPPENAPPHTPVQRGAIQAYVYQNIAGSISTSLQQLLLAITLPTTPGSDLQIYQAAVDSAITASNQQILDGVREIFNRTLLINAPAPANRLGEDFNSSSGSSTGSSTSTSSSSSSSGSGTSSTSA